MSFDKFNQREWDAAMRLALDEAAMAVAAGDVPVGAVVLSPDGSILGRGHNQRELTHDPTAHAELIALREAALALKSWRLDECTLVVTLEPCPMCAGAIGQSRVTRLVFGAYDDKAGAVGSVWDVLRDRKALHRPEVVSGVLEAESVALLGEFFASRR